jgi:hypothetical protein
VGLAQRHPMTGKQASHCDRFLDLVKPQNESHGGIG